MDKPVIFTENDVKDPQLLLRQLRNTSDRLLSLAGRVDKIERTPTTPDFGEIRRQMQASGNEPINVNGLLGVLAQPQPASVTLYSTAPTGPVLQQLRDQQLVLIGTTATGFSLNYVQGGSPGKLFQLTAGLTTSAVLSTSTNFVTLDTTQTITGSKTFGDGTGTPAIDLNGAAGQNKVISFFTTSSVRWKVRSNATAEGGANSGSDFEIVGLSDVGVQLGIYATINRATGNVTLLKKISSYDGQTLVGEGVPALVAQSAINAQSSNVAATTLFTAPATGQYRINYIMQTTATGTSNVTFNVIFTDDIGAISLGQPPMFFTAASRQSNVITFRSCSGAVIQYSTNIATSTVAPIGAYSVYTQLERLS